MFQLKRLGATGAALGVILALAASVAVAQTNGQATPGQSQSSSPAAAPAQPDPGASASDQTSGTVTIFSKRNTRRAPNSTVIGTQSASSCGFMDTTNSANDQAVQDYLTDFYGDDANQMEEQSAPSDISGNDPTNNSPASKTIRNNSPYGDASREGSTNTPDGVGEPGSPPPSQTPGAASCGPADQAFAAGRSYIAQHDHSLTDAYNAFDAKDFPKALALFKASYDKMGYDVAALMEGKMYVAGLGTPRDMDKGIAWLKKATEAPFDPKMAVRFNPDDPDYMNSRIDAAMTLAKIYVAGYHIKRSPADAKHWYLKADDFGFVPASHIVGQIYENGYAGEKSLPKAVTYFKKAGIVGYAPSEYELGVILYNGGDGVAQDKKTAADWLYQAAKRGYANALYAIGRMHDLGDTLPADPQKAIVYYKEAALKGQPDAQNALGLYFYTGEMVGKDLVTARKWFLAAAKGGNADAMFNLGVMLVNGEGGAKDMVTAYVWFRLADQMGLEKGGAAAKELEGKLTPDEKAKAEALLQPAPKQ
ncbi:hypothetical protein [Asticcacaulis solisilvae]|uniref:hypothetical protein n=1 Tax=Asticcacaulis solisilvae TaxID=1217274 RepID=UPI003FD87D30